MNFRFQLKWTALVFCAVVTVACEGGMNSPSSPSAVAGNASALNADGSNLKANSPLAISPLFESTNISIAPTLAARSASGRYETASMAQRFQVSSDDFANIVASGMGVTDASGITRFTVDPALTGGRRYVWRVRAEVGDAFGPWSNVMAFTTAGGAGTPTTPGSTTPSGSGPRPADPPAGVRLPLPDMQGVLARFSDASESCPRGLKGRQQPVAGSRHRCLPAG